jgi:hypothetical protein
VAQYAWQRTLQQDWHHTQHKVNSIYPFSFFFVSLSIIANIFYLGCNCARTTQAPTNTGSVCGSYYYRGRGKRQLASLSTRPQTQASINITSTTGANSNSTPDLPSSTIVNSSSTTEALETTPVSTPEPLSNPNNVGSIRMDIVNGVVQISRFAVI